VDVEYEITVNGQDATVFASLDYTLSAGSPAYRTWDCPMGYPGDPGELEVGEFTDVGVEFDGPPIRGTVKDRAFSLEECFPSDWKVVGLPTEQQINAACEEDAANGGH